MAWQDINTVETVDAAHDSLDRYLNEYYYIRTLEKRVWDDITENIHWVLNDGGPDTLYALAQDTTNGVDDSLCERGSEALDSGFIYTSDIMAAWAEYDYPEPDEYGMGDTIIQSIAFAVVESVDVSAIAHEAADAVASWYEDNYLNAE